MSAMPQTRAGFVAVIGAPNAGKSTLTNALVGEKVSIVTHKVQTTRFQVRGIAMLQTGDGVEAQVVLVDTPGIFAPKEKMTIIASPQHRRNCTQGATQNTTLSKRHVWQKCLP